MRSRALCERIQGLALDVSWLDQLDQTVAQQAGFATLPDDEQLRAFWSYVLDCDFNLAGAGSLPPGIKDWHKRVLAGRYVLQLDEAVNMAAAAKQRYDSDARGRCLKVHLTDGKQQIIGMEYMHVPDLPTLCPAGIKVAVTNAEVRRGMLLLRPDNTAVLGGKVERLEQARLKAAARWTRPPTGTGGRGGQAQPDLYGEASAAAWADEGPPIAAGGEGGSASLNGSLQPGLVQQPTAAMRPAVLSAGVPAAGGFAGMRAPALQLTGSSDRAGREPAGLHIHSNGSMVDRSSAPPRMARLAQPVLAASGHAATEVSDDPPLTVPSPTQAEVAELSSGPGRSGHSGRPAVPSTRPASLPGSPRRSSLVLQASTANQRNQRAAPRALAAGSNEASMSADAPAGASSVAHELDGGGSVTDGDELLAVQARDALEYVPETEVQMDFGDADLHMHDADPYVDEGPEELVEVISLRVTPTRQQPPLSTPAEGTGDEQHMDDQAPPAGSSIAPLSVTRLSCTDGPTPVSTSALVPSPVTAQSVTANTTAPAQSSEFTCLALMAQRLASHPALPLPVQFQVLGRIMRILPPLRFRDPTTGAPTSYSFDVEIEDGSMRMMAVLAHEPIQALIGLTPQQLMSGLQERPDETRGRTSAAGVRMASYVGPLHLQLHELGAPPVICGLHGDLPTDVCY